MPLSIAAINSLDAAAFAAQLGHVCEHAPWVARRAAERRPFRSRDDLHRAMLAVIAAASEAEQLTLLRNHPELAGKAAIAGDLTADSKKEQGGAGLDRLTAAEYERFHALNRAYNEKFGFPFILAVKGKTKDEILAAFAARVDNDRAEEFRTALEQVGRIIGFRLADIVEQ
ncbi:MAG TPA: 2-oxo-4-hydroxy-4-carboxy-5-ureidoimidazoline decarboxylase [Xanthobacteraceae bacterium]|nr:2-oxo-4-hydroxy-4-carboxy-5-ureidoimidazoline decarboxylase [Xanthobacteraceae bacterium]